MENTFENDGKTIGIIAYITLIGWVVAFIMNSSKKMNMPPFTLDKCLDWYSYPF